MLLYFVLTKIKGLQYFQSETCMSGCGAAAHFNSNFNSLHNFFFICSFLSCLLNMPLHT